MLKYFHDIITALEALMAHKLKSFLTALGIVFGVAAVISMLAIGRGAQKEILDQIKLVGVNNIIITPVIKDQKAEKETEGEKEVRKFSRGLTLSDADVIRQNIPTVMKISGEISISEMVLQNGKSLNANLVGIDSPYFDLFNIKLTDGLEFNTFQYDHGEPVCIIGHDINTRLFSKTKAIGQYLKCGDVWLKVIGILEERAGISLSAETKDKNRNFNDNIFIPVKTMLLRYSNRALITEIKLHDYDDEESSSADRQNTNQLDRIIVQVRETEELEPTVEVLNRMILRRHSDVKDFEISVPELLLKQQQKTKDIFNIVLGAIAAISLLVGGIGIMNIMLASVLERVREIGIRQAIGATRKDIVIQFLAESVFISVGGGIIGVLAGVILSKLIMKISGVMTIITWYSVILSFVISVAVGIIFGFMPAKNASRKDIVESIRYE